jgi:hypothetical protein
MSEISSRLLPASEQSHVLQPAQPEPAGAPKVPNDAKGVSVARAEHPSPENSSSAAFAVLEPHAARGKVWSEGEIEIAIRTPGEAANIPTKAWTARRAETALRDDGNVYRVLPPNLKRDRRLIAIALNSRPISGPNRLTGPLEFVPRDLVTKDRCLAALYAGYGPTFEAVPERLKRDTDIQLAACLRNFAAVYALKPTERNEDIWVASVRSLLRMNMAPSEIDKLWVKENVPEELRTTCLEKALKMEQSGEPRRPATPTCIDPYDPTKPGTLVVKRLSLPKERDEQITAELRTESFDLATDEVTCSALEKVFAHPKDPPVDESGRYLYTFPRKDLRAAEPSEPSRRDDKGEPLSAGPEHSA